MLQKTLGLTLGLIGALGLTGCGTTGGGSSSGSQGSARPVAAPLAGGATSVTPGSVTSDPGTRSLPVGNILGAVPVETDPLDGYRGAAPAQPTWTESAIPVQAPAPTGLGAPPIPAPPSTPTEWPTR